MFVRPKEFVFLPVNLHSEIADKGDFYEITLTADYYAKSVCLSLKNEDGMFSDNWFDVHGDLPVTVTLTKSAKLDFDLIKRELTVEHY